MRRLERSATGQRPVDSLRPVAGKSVARLGSVVIGVTGSDRDDLGASYARFSFRIIARRIVVVGRAVRISLSLAVGIRMTPSEYCIEVQRTFSPALNKSTVQLGLLGESGEVADVIKKAMERGQPVNRNKLIEELGDVLWYTAAKLHLHNSVMVHDQTFWPHINHSFYNLACVLCKQASWLGEAKYPYEYEDSAKKVISLVTEIGSLLSPAVSLEEIMELNIQKLRKRHVDGFKAPTARPNVLVRIWRVI